MATQDIRSISQLKTSPAECIEAVSEHGRTLVITQHGEAKAVMMGAEEYDRWRQTFAMLRLLAMSQAEHRAGRASDSEEVFERLEALLDD